MQQPAASQVLIAPRRAVMVEKEDKEATETEGSARKIFESNESKIHKPKH